MGLNSYFLHDLEKKGSLNPTFSQCFEKGESIGYISWSLTPRSTGSQFSRIPGSDPGVGPATPLSLVGRREHVQAGKQSRPRDLPSRVIIGGVG